jgi:hypothetical protein
VILAFDIVDKICESKIEIEVTEDGFVSSPGYPLSIPQEFTECWWILTVDRSYRIFIELIAIDLPPPTKEKCVQAYLSYGGSVTKKLSFD